MRAVWVLLPALAALSAYYVYLPLPGTVSDSWKLMLLDATFRAVQQTVRRGAGGHPWGWPLWWCWWWWWEPLGLAPRLLGDS